jgi:2-amino-4-hydroxy-6-hydroxymethyldihydropteridine diphosphokinase
MIYAIALGSNRCHGRYGPPRSVIAAALSALELPLIAQSRLVETVPLGPSNRRYANAVALADSDLEPDELVDHLKAIERSFGRRSGQRWAARVLDLDIILWSGGAWSSPGLTIPHREFRRRAFVLDPLCQIAAGWRDPVSGQTVRQLKALLDRPRSCP